MLRGLDADSFIGRLVNSYIGRYSLQLTFTVSKRKLSKNRAAFYRSMQVWLLQVVTGFVVTEHARTRQNE